MKTRYLLCLMIPLMGLVPLKAAPVETKPIQSLASADWLEAFVDDQFQPLTGPEQPGFGVLITQNGAPVFIKGYGLADLEHGARVTAQSRFYIASMSKQFTAAIIAQMIVEERLTLNGPVRRFLPDLPDAYEGVTIGQLLFHTGGVREYTSMMLIRGDDPRLQNRMNTEDAYRLIRAQQALDFTPGTQYRYSSSGYVLLAKIIEAIEQKPFHTVAQDRLFAPLNMADTLFDSDHARPVKNRVQSYQPAPPGNVMAWRRWLKHFDVVGDGGLLITLKDMAVWDAELYGGVVFGAKWHRLIHTKGTLEGGSALSYGFGLWQTRLMGQKVIAHGGGMGGFIADQIRLPDAGLSLYVFANRNDDGAFQGWELAKRLITRLGLDKDEKTGASESARKLPTSPVKETALAAPLARDYTPWLGSYFADQINNRYFLRENAEGHMVLHGGSDTWIANLEIIDDTRLRVIPSGHVLSLHEGENGNYFDLAQQNRTIKAKSYDPTPPQDINDLKRLSGTFWSPELESLISFTVKGNTFWMRYAQHPPEQLYPVTDNANITWNAKDTVWTGRTMVKFRFGKMDEPVYVDIGDGRVTGIRFFNTRTAGQIKLTQN